jgi:hypothetical protein
LLLQKPVYGFVIHLPIHMDEKLPEPRHLLKIRAEVKRDDTCFPEQRKTFSIFFRDLFQSFGGDVIKRPRAASMATSKR